MTTLTSETTVLDLLIEAKQYDADNITVEDADAFDALPEGTQLADLKDEELYSKGEGSEGRTAGGRAISDIDNYLPALILNPEILGDFKVPPTPVAVDTRVAVKSDAPSSVPPRYARARVVAVNGSILTIVDDGSNASAFRFTGRHVVRNSEVRVLADQEYPKSSYLVVEPIGEETTPVILDVAALNALGEGAFVTVADYPNTGAVKVDGRFQRINRLAAREGVVRVYDAHYYLSAYLDAGEAILVHHAGN